MLAFTIMTKRFVFKCESCNHKEMGIIPFRLTLKSQIRTFNEFEEEFMRNYKCPKCGWSKHNN